MYSNIDMYSNTDMPPERPSNPYKKPWWWHVGSWVFTSVVGGVFLLGMFTGVSYIVADPKKPVPQRKPSLEGRYHYKATYVKNYDGDTCTLMLDMGLNVYVKMTGRLYGINTPELRGTRGDEKKKALEAKQFLEDKLKNAKRIIVTTLKDKKGKYGRYIITIWVDDDILAINGQLLKKGLAVEYLK